MVNYKIQIKKSALKEMHKIPKKDLQRITGRISLLSQNPMPPGAEKLASQNLFRIRQGDYRILYSIDTKEEIVYIIKIGHRGEVYR